MSGSPVASSSRVRLDSDIVSRPVTLPSSPVQREEQNEVEDEITAAGHDDAEKGTDEDDISLHSEEFSDEEEEYEVERQRRIRENQRLLDSLGIAGNSIAAAPSPSHHKDVKKGRPKGPKTPRDSNKPVYDRSGYILSLPAPGGRQRLARVEMPSDRGLRRRIAEGEYSDVTHWWEGEERRWQVGKGGVATEDDEEIGGVTKNFRWRKWQGLERELRREIRARGEANNRDKRGQGVVEQVGNQGEPTTYSLLPGAPCHQCKRKSDKPKMKCRNVSPICRAIFCETCCKRYSYFTFDRDSRSFICPLCKDCCNCANCIRKRKLTHLLGPGKLGVKRKDIAKTGMTVQAWLEGALEDKVGVPFDRVRIVDQAFDVISAELPPEPMEEEEIQVQATKRKRKTKESKEPKEPKAKKQKGERKTKTNGNDKGSKLDVSSKVDQVKANNLVLKFKIPTMPTRIKEVDSDGDTVAGYSDDEAASEASSRLTSLSSETPPPPALSPRIKFNMNQYMSTIAQRQSVSGVQDRSNENPPARKRKPPPIGNIIRAPKHASFSPPEESEVEPNQNQPQFTNTNTNMMTPFTTQSNISNGSEQWNQTPNHPIQTFSYNGYSSVPPFVEVSRPYESHEGYGFPPPYSHSPPTTDRILTINNNTITTTSNTTATATAAATMAPIGYESFPSIHSVQPIRAFQPNQMNHLLSATLQDEEDRPSIQQGREHVEWMDHSGLTLARRYDSRYP